MFVSRDRYFCSNKTALAMVRASFGSWHKKRCKTDGNFQMRLLGEVRFKRQSAGHAQSVEKCDNSHRNSFHKFLFQHLRNWRTEQWLQTALSRTL